MKTLIVYYSLTGNTRNVAQKIANIMKADVDEIVVEGKHFPFQKKFEMDYKKNPADYDLVIVGCPVWAFGPVPAVKRYLIENKSKIKKMAFFCTHAGIIGKTLQKIEEIVKPASKLDIKFTRFKNKPEKNYENKIKKFCEELG